MRKESRLTIMKHNFEFRTDEVTVHPNKKYSRVQL